METGHSLIANNQNPITPSSSSSSSSSSSQNPFLVQSDANSMDNNSSNKCVSNPLDETQSQQNTDTNTNDFDGTTSIASPTFELSNLEHIHTPIDTTNNEHSNDMPEGQTLEHGMNKGQEIQNPRVQVMERPNESNSITSPYVFPSHVFARNNTNGQVEWSTASNESLFSIYMGNMSFSSELACFKSCEMDKPGDVIITDQQPNNNQPPTPVNKFNDISQRTAELHEEGLKVTEAKAAETMREVIMESSRTTENKEDKKSTSTQLHSDGSTKSYAFQT